MFRYAHIDGNNIVFGVYFLSGPVVRPDYIESETAEIGQTYNPVTGEFS
jgi:hypothetical protein